MNQQSETMENPKSIDIIRLKDWSLITGGGGGVLPQQKGGTENVKAMLRGAQKVLGYFFLR